MPEQFLSVFRTTRRDCPQVMEVESLSLDTPHEPFSEG